MESGILLLIVKCLFNAMPYMIDEALLPERCIHAPREPSQIIRLDYLGKEYFAQVKYKCLYLSEHEDMESPEFILLLQDLYI